MQFDEHGNLTPYEPIPVKQTEIQNELVRSFPLSMTRDNLFDSFVRYNEELGAALKNEFRQWVDGSFVTIKQNPADVDIANFIANDRFDVNADALMPFFTVGGSLETWSVDAHLIPVYSESDERYENTLARIRYFRKWFGRDKMNRPKGFLENEVRNGTERNHP